MAVFVISFHAPRVGRDDDFCSYGKRKGEFQSTRPVWGATRARLRHIRHISDFNPRAPCGARQGLFTTKVAIYIFQSTRPVWGATGNDRMDEPLCEFQSTRPVWGATVYGGYESW